MNDSPSTRPNTGRSTLRSLGFLAAGALGALGVTQYMAQQQTIADLARSLEQLEQAQEDLVTRAPAFDLTAPSALVEQASGPGATAVAALVPDDSATLSAAERLRQIVATTPLPETLDIIDPVERIETLAIIDAGVQELVNAVVEGDYAVHTNYEDEFFSGRIHFAFVKNNEDQTALEQFIARAAERGILAHSSSVLDGEGKVNGHILLFDLVERALENGTLAEQEAGEKMREVARAMLAAEVDTQEDLATFDAAGDRYYVVESGDSLARISLQFYGDTRSFQLIFDANRDQLTSPEQINIGQRLLIPEV
jgi:nucleoid-associated protein YgaU